MTVDLLGFKHHPLHVEAADALKYGVFGDWLYEDFQLVRDRANAYDARAIAVDRIKDGVRLAFVSADTLPHLLKWLEDNDFGDDLSCVKLVAKHVRYDARRRLVRLTCECVLD